MTIIIDPIPTGPLKRDIIERAFGLMAMLGYEFGREPEEVAHALGELESMMAEWEADFGFTGYAYSDEPGNAAEASGLLLADVNGVVAGLVQAIAAAHGKTLPPEAIKRMAKSVTSLRAGYASIPTMPFAARTIVGAGNRSTLGGQFLSDDTAI